MFSLILHWRRLDINQSRQKCLLLYGVFQNRVATKDNLYKRGIIDQRATLYVGECGVEESVSHLFFECPKFAGTW
jgi:hypothetical protein